MIPSSFAKKQQFFGTLASNSSVTLGRPPVISFTFICDTAILAIISPAFISSPSSTFNKHPSGNG